MEDEITRFAWGIQVIRTPEGLADMRTHSYNKGIRTEIIIIQMKTFLKSLEDDYYHTFGKPSDRKNG
ncbi:MAG: hypothetical protein AABX70_04200 [Nanoarchaeota archaeon]